MRTTIALPDDLLKQAKIAAAQRHCSLAELVGETLRKSLSERDGKVGVRKVRLPTFKGTGLRPGINLDDTSELLDRMEAQR